MTNNPTTPPLAAEMVLPVEWRQPYQYLDVFRLFVGPFYAGEVAHSVTEGWKASSPILSRILAYPTKEAAQIDLECMVRMLGRGA